MKNSVNNNKRFFSNAVKPLYIIVLLLLFGIVVLRVFTYR